MDRVIAGLMRKTLMVTVLAAVVVLSIGVVNAEGVPQAPMALTDIPVEGDVTQTGTGALAADGLSLDDESLADLLLQFEGVRLEGERVVLEGADDQEFTLELDLEEMADRLVRPTGNPLFDLAK